MNSNKTKAAVCEMCGGKLVFQPEGDIFECVSCGISYPKDWVKSKIQEISGTVKLEGPVEIKGALNVEGFSSLENLVNSAEKLIGAKMFDEAAATYAKMRKDFPDSQHGWWGDVRVQSREFSSTGIDIEATKKISYDIVDSKPDLFPAVFGIDANRLFEHYQKALRLAPESEQAMMHAQMKKFTSLMGPQTNNVEAMIDARGSEVSLEAETQGKKRDAAKFLVDEAMMRSSILANKIESNYASANSKVNSGYFKAIQITAKVMFGGFILGFVYTVIGPTRALGLILLAISGVSAVLLIVLRVILFFSGMIQKRYKEDIGRAIVTLKAMLVQEVENLNKKQAELRVVCEEMQAIESRQNKIRLNKTAVGEYFNIIKNL